MEWINPRYEELVETLSQANAERRPADGPVRGLVVPEPDED
ncbi:hypothetical protein [Streptomyces fuscigenes]|nr:hypothetical protein [Streptomyces fuscigenes]